MIAVRRQAPGVMRHASFVMRRFLPLALAPALAAAQISPIARALDLEQRGRLREAASAFREAVRDLPVPALLGYERVMMELGEPDSVLVVADSLIRARPGDATPRAIQLRTLHAAGRRAEERAAFERWLAGAPRADAAPYREYARLLLAQGESAAADSVLERARRALGDVREFAVELAQIRGSLGRWRDAASTWRDVVERAPFLEQAAVFSMQRADSAGRAGIRETLSGAPVTVGVRRLLAQLELAWGNPGAAWAAVRPLPPDSAAVRAWREIGERAEQHEAWPAARDAFAAVADAQFSVAIVLRAAAAALAAGDPASALRAGRLAASRLDSSAAAGSAGPVIVSALAELGRAGDAEGVARAYERWLDGPSRDRMRRAVAWAWIRSGDVARARELLRGLPADEEAGEIGAWLALYDGDLRAARAGFAAARRTSPETVRAMALLSRTRRDAAPTLGRAFLALARGDSARAAADLELAASEVPDASGMVLLQAARLRLAGADPAAGERLLARIATELAAAPEAPEAELEWSRALARRGDVGGAMARLEHLILTHPSSALLPQARRELDVLRGRRAPDRT